MTILELKEFYDNIYWILSHIAVILFFATIIIILISFISNRPNLFVIEQGEDVYILSSPCYLKVIFESGSYSFLAPSHASTIKIPLSSSVKNKSYRYVGKDKEFTYYCDCSYEIIKTSFLREGKLINTK